MVGSYSVKNKSAICHCKQVLSHHSVMPQGKCKKFSLTFPRGAHDFAVACIETDIEILHSCSGINQRGSPKLLLFMEMFVRVPLYLRKLNNASVTDTYCPPRSDDLLHETPPPTCQKCRELALEDLPRVFLYINDIVTFSGNGRCSPVWVRLFSQ